MNFVMFQGRFLVELKKDRSLCVAGTILGVDAKRYVSESVQIVLSNDLGFTVSTHHTAEH